MLHMYNVMGIMSWVVSCCTWVVKNPKNNYVLPLCGDYVHCVLLKVCGFRLPLGGNAWGKGTCINLRGVLTLAPGSTLTGSGLHPCLVTSCKVVWKALWLYCALSGYSRWLEVTNLMCIWG